MNRSTAAPATTSSASAQQNEQAIIERALRGELDAFNELVVKYERLTYSVAYRMLQSQDAAADAVQDSFIKAYRALPTFKGGQFKSWLLRILVNTCYDVLRARRRHETTSIDEPEMDPDYASEYVDPIEGPQAYVERMELSALIELGLRALPPDQRLVLGLCDIHGYAYEEISEITGMAMGTVKSRISRGRTKLREFLLQQPELLPASFRPRIE